MCAPTMSQYAAVDALQYGENRVIAGAHWQSDVDMTRLAAAIAYSRLQTIPTFRSQMERAKSEFSAYTSSRPAGFETLAKEAFP